MRTRLHDRQAYKAIFVRRVTLAELDHSINGLEAAKANAERLAEEVVEIITAKQGKRELQNAHA
jgi:chromosome partitioning protein